MVYRTPQDCGKMRERWRLDRIERALIDARIDIRKKKELLWPCIHMASSIVGSDWGLIKRILSTRIRIEYETLRIRIELFFQDIYYLRIKGISVEDYEKQKDAEFEEITELLQKAARGENEL